MSPLGRSVSSHEASGPLLGFARNGHSPSTPYCRLSSHNRARSTITVIIPKALSPEGREPLGVEAPHSGRSGRDTAVRLLDSTQILVSVVTD